MSLIPIRSFSDQLPVIFVEARMQGNPNAVLAQLGLSLDADECNVALFTRTSGVLLVVGVGSYMVYRMFVRLLGRNFMWTLVDQARVDTLSRSDVRLLHPARIVHGSDIEDFCSPVFADDEYSDSCSEVSARTKNTFLSLECSPSRRRHLVSRSFRDRALTNVPTPLEKRNQRRQIHDEVDEVMRRPANDRYRIHARRLSARSESEASRGLSQMSVTPSEKSASLRLLWDDPQWDSELDLTRPDVLRRGQSASPSNISEMSEFLAAKNIFGDTASSKIDEEDDRVDAVLDSESVQDDTTSESMQQARDLIERSCMTDSQHLYRIVAGCIASSDAVSVCSERSTQSFLSLRQRAAASGTSAGLLELTRCSLAHGGGLEMLSNSMTDSAISKDTATTSSAARNMNRSMLFDSAIGTDLISSEDEACVAVPTSVSARVLRVPSNNDSSIIRRTGLNLINEDQRSVAISERSLEWFEDEFYGVNGLSAECGGTEHEELVVDLGAFRIDHSQVFDATPDSPQASTSLAAGFGLSPKGAKHDSERSSKFSLPSRRCCLNGTRDLMVWAREQFSADSPQLKMLQSLYSSRRRLKRIGIKRSDDFSVHLLASVLHSAFYHNLAIFPCSNFAIVQEINQSSDATVVSFGGIGLIVDRFKRATAIVGAFARYDFLKQWPLLREDIVSQNNSSNTVMSNDLLAVDIMRTLWDVQHAGSGAREKIVDGRCVEALRLMLVLRALDVFESLDEFHSLPRSFYSRLFTDHNPRQIMHRINEGIFEEDELCLLADTLRIRLEIFDCTISAKNESPSMHLYPDAENSFPVLSFIKANDRYLYSVYYMAD